MMHSFLLTTLTVFIKSNPQVPVSVEVNVRFAPGIQLLFFQDCLPLPFYILTLRIHVYIYIKDKLCELEERNGRECMPDTVSQTNRKKKRITAMTFFSRHIVIGKFTTLDDPHGINYYFSFEIMLMMMMPISVKSD